MKNTCKLILDNKSQLDVALHEKKEIETTVYELSD